MTKVLLINPFVKEYDLSGGIITYIPIGLLSLASAIRGICDLKILDCLRDSCETRRTRDFILYGTPVERIKEIIRDFSPDIVGISIPFSAQSDNAKTICGICKELDPKITVVFGGPDASVNYSRLLKETLCDFCVVGEGEETFFEFVKKFNSGSSLESIEGLAYKKDGKIYYKPREFLCELDKLPFPAYDLIDIKAYLRDKNLYRDRSIIKNSISMVTSRGCPFDCVFCSIRKHMGHVYRYHSPDYVIRHLRFIIKNYGITNFHFEDDNISLDKKRFEKILDGIIENGFKLQWDVPNGLRADTLDFNLLKKIKRSGCKKLTIAIESGNQNVLDNIIKKRLSLDYVIDVVKNCKKLRILASSFYVIGFPGESIKNMKETLGLALRLLKEYDILPCLLIATPLYGTELYEICEKNGYIKKDLTDKDFATGTQVYGNPLISTKDFTGEDVKNLARDYLSTLKKELIIYAFKHPLFLFKKIREKIPFISRYLSPVL
ncbi:MAG: cobalamin-dependent protein [Candidatus Omnitrophica bacterium]|nr:cobalamin-dependent protein [Candidatus Omnitrophota bacterium]